MYQIPCSCGQVYFGETIRRLETRMKEHQDACENGTLEKSAVVEHAWKKHYPIKWEDTGILAQARGHKELRLEEAFHIRRIPAGNCLKHDLELELQNYWVATFRKLQNKRKQQRTRPSHHCGSNLQAIKSSNATAHTSFWPT